MGNILEYVLKLYENIVNIDDDVGGGSGGGG
jgi:hypothetical protein